MGASNVKDLLLAPSLSPPEVASRLAPYGFKEIERADANLQAMADEPRSRKLLAEILEDLLSSLGRSADPDRALDYMERFARAAVDKLNLFSHLKSSPRTLSILARTFGGSPFMAEILIRDPVYLYWLTDPVILEKERPKKMLEADLSDSLRHLKSEPKKLDALRRFKRREILRIGVRDLLRIAGVEEIVADLSALAEAVIQKAYEISEDSLREEYGGSLKKNSSGGNARRGFTVLGMGKLGGGELNFSSDLDLMFLYLSDRGNVFRRSPGRPKRRGASLSKPEYFERLSRKVTAALGQMTQEGYLYRVDLRLRPEGRAGAIAAPLDSFRRYYSARGETWERMALLKAWPAAGDRRLGLKFIKAVRPFILGRSLDGASLQAIRRLKERIDRKISSRGQSDRNVKLGLGGIREIEWIVQTFQIAFGKKHPGIVERNTLKALRALRKHGFLSREEDRLLTEAYRFLRGLENRLQMASDFQTHSIPADEKELRACAVGLGYEDAGGESAAGLFLKEVRLHTGRVNRIFQELFHSPGAPRFLAGGARRKPDGASKGA
jgi:glutamate-ammonia-ligase adenylyltransferase